MNSARLSPSVEQLGTHSTSSSVVKPDDVGWDRAPTVEQLGSTELLMDEEDGKVPHMELGFLPSLPSTWVAPQELDPFLPDILDAPVGSPAVSRSHPSTTNS